MSRIKKKFIRFGTGAEEVSARDIPANYTSTNYTADQVASEGNDKVSAHLKGIDTVLANFDIINNPTGFPDRTSTTISFDNSTRTFTISPVSSSFDFYFDGKKFTKSSPQTVVIPDTIGNHFILFNSSGTLISTQVGGADNLLINNVFVAVLYWDTVRQELVYFGEERHGLMDPTVHKLWHLTRGTQYLSGLGLGNFPGGFPLGNSDSDAQFSCEDGTVVDEDIYIDINDGSPQELSTILQAPVFYKYGSSGFWRKNWTEKTWQASTVYDIADLIIDNDYLYSPSVAGTSGGTIPTFPTTIGGTVTDNTVTWQCVGNINFPVYNAVAGNNLLAYNEFNGSQWVQTEAANNDFVLSHIFATNDVNHPIIAVQGQATYTTLGNAQTGAVNEINDLITEGLPFEEFLVIGTVIYQTGTSGTNFPQAALRETDAGDPYVDFRTSNLSPSASASAHSQLSNLAYDVSGHSGFQRKTWQATANPTASNDEVNSAGNAVNFDEGDFWINTATNSLYICVDATDDNAIWNQVSTGASGSQGDISETSFSINNNVTTPTTITGFSFSNAVVRSFKAQVSVEIDATSDLFEIVEIVGIQKGSEWDLSITRTGDDSGVEFSISAGGQLQYESASYSGFVSGTLKFRATTTTV